jgi:prepilin-type processing-associated H-X9-DG protein
MFNAYTTPNTKIPDWIANGYCRYPYLTNPPCINTTAAAGFAHAQDSYNASRSYHAGGVNALLADGSVKFFKNSINVLTWRALSTPSAGEVVSSDAF